MNIREFIDSVKAGMLGEVDIYKYLKETDRRALKDLYDRVYIASVACINEIGQGYDNLNKASAIIAKYAKELLSNKNKRVRMEESIKAFAMPNSIELIVDNALSLLK
jgi:hypothetical protein